MLGSKYESNVSVNDNDAPPPDVITFTELASAMQMDEDALLCRLATILREREGSEDA